MTSPRFQILQTFRLVDALAMVVALVILFGVLMPAAQKARASAAQLQCKNNLLQVGTAVQMFTAANHGYFPVCAANPAVPTNIGGIPYIINQATQEPYLPSQNVYLPPLTSPLQGGLGGIIDHCGGNTKLFICPMDTGPVFSVPSAQIEPADRPYHVSLGQIMSKSPPAWFTDAFPDKDFAANPPYTTGLNGGPYPGLSYEWNTSVNGGTALPQPPIWGQVRNGWMPLSSILLVSDLDVFHNGRQNTLYADGHVP